MKISKELYTFFKEWLEWAESGKDHEVFSSHVGLCSNISWWSHYNGLSTELYKLLYETFGECTNPFGEDDYLCRYQSGTQHLCPKRLAFVREQIYKHECLVAATKQP